MRLSEREFAQLAADKKSAKPKAPKETDTQNAIREYLCWHGWYVIRHQQSLGSLKGLTDLTALKEGWTVYIEVKTLTGRLSEDQEKFRDNVVAHGGTYVVARSVEDVQFLCGVPVMELQSRWLGKVVGE
ncbi:VRR-NUC domain-containing protein [Sporomusa sp. KB1]|jgi:hypothetical protein|uniref:VRR-NUC domain-containing protein n=1 Tax=Sporomusa sp. KB1 TaxID=943346 RepID=UPI0011ADAC23|nr:VRR-NUC domain-containing protein [Sporomusa sp. KB1]TWH48524.1 VRR-NUC domain-containing protein [Sporomusa sp. KB1]